MKRVFALCAAAAVAFAACSNPIAGTNPESPAATGAVAQPTEAGAPAKAPQDIARKALSRIVDNAADAYEADDDVASAKLISVNAASQEHNFFDDATDWLKFDAVSGRVYNLESWVYGSADTMFYLYNAANQTTALASNDDKGDGTYGSQLSWTCPASGTYYLKVASYAAAVGAGKAYEVIVLDNTVARDAWEDDDTKIKANLIYTNGSNQSHDFSDDSADWVRLYMSQGYHYSFDSVVAGTADTMFYLYNASDVQVAYNDDKGNGTYGSHVEYTCPASGYYYLKIASYAGAIGANKGYTVNVLQSSIPYKKWTIMVYLDADNNLDPFGVNDLNEMKNVANSNDVNIIVLWDDTSTHHGYYKVTNGTLTLLQDIGEVNMGDPNTAINFINYVAANYPADQYFFDFWNHGGGVDRSEVVKGVCWDDSAPGDHLTEVEQKNIFTAFKAKIGKKVDIVGFDACLMGMLETAYQYYNLADYMIASEQTIPGNGWDYNFISSVVANPAITPAQLASQVVSSYAAYYASSSNVTLAVYNLNNAPNAAYYLSSFCTTARNSGIAAATFKSLALSALDFSGVSKDLTGFMNAVNASAAMNATVKSAATSVVNALNSLKVAEWHSANYNNKAYGVAIMMKPDTAVYQQLQMSIDYQWNEFMTFCGF